MFTKYKERGYYDIAGRELFNVLLYTRRLSLEQIADMTGYSVNFLKLISYNDAVVSKAFYNALDKATRGEKSCKAKSKRKIKNICKSEKIN
jgi:hypothetical protein